jgi:hypothetical protein
MVGDNIEGALKQTPAELSKFEEAELEELEEAERLETAAQEVPRPSRAVASAQSPKVEAPEEMEELELLEEVPEAPIGEEEPILVETSREKESAPVARRKESAPVARREEVARLVSSGVIKSWTIAEIAKIVEQSRSAIVMENGVYRVKEELYASDQREKARSTVAAREEKLREIAEKVVRHGEQEEKAADEAAAEYAGAEELALSGIGDLIRDEGGIDLLKVVSEGGESEVEEVLTQERESANPIRWKKNGADYDEFLSSYPRSFTHTTQMKSLVEVSRRVSAVSAGLLLKSAKGYAPDLSIGVSEKSLKTLTIANVDPLYSILLAHRKAVAVNRNPAEIAVLKEKLDADDLRYMKRILLLPASFRGQDAYLLLAFAIETEISIEGMITALAVQ